MSFISSHLGNEENKASTFERNGKKSKGISKSELDKKDKEPIDMDNTQRVIKKLTNDFIDLKKNKGEEKKPFKILFKKKTNMDSYPPIPPTSSINLEDYAMEIFCHTHHVNHSEKTFP